MTAGSINSSPVGNWYASQAAAYGGQRVAGAAGPVGAATPWPQLAPSQAAQVQSPGAIVRNPYAPAIGRRADGTAVIDMAQLVPASHSPAEVDQVRAYASDLARSATGRNLLLTAASMGGKLVLATPQQLTTAGLGTAAGKYLSASRSVLVDPRQPHQEAVQTLAHELQHLVDHVGGQGIGTQRSEARAFLAEAQVAGQLGWPVGSGAPFSTDRATGRVLSEGESMQRVASSRWYARLPAEAPVQQSFGWTVGMPVTIASTPQGATTTAMSAGPVAGAAQQLPAAVGAQQVDSFVRPAAARPTAGMAVAIAAPTAPAAPVAASRDPFAMLDAIRRASAGR